MTDNAQLDEEEAPVPICEICWMEMTSKWEPEGVTEDGELLMKLVSLGIPLLTMPSQVETCIKCGKPTVAGIYLIASEFDISVEAQLSENNEEEQQS